MTITQRSLSIVVPVFQSAETLELLYKRLSEQLNILCADWEIIYIDDASVDDSWEKLLKLHRGDSRVKAVRLAYNHGQQHATLCGLRYATKDYVITIDDDLQCFPEDMPLFVNMLNTDKRLVIGKIKETTKQHSWWRNIGSRANQYLAGRILGKPKWLYLSSYRGMPINIAKQITNYHGAHPHITALLLKVVPAKYIANVDIRHAKRVDGKGSSYSLRKLIKTMSYLLINHSYLPLRMMVAWGIVISFASLAYAVWIAITAMMADYTAPGWASLAVLISFLSGNILLCMGILGEYLGRLVEEASHVEQCSVFEELL